MLRRSSLQAWAITLLPALPFVALPGRVQAETITFQNRCPVPLVLHAVYLQRGVMERDRPIRLNPREITPAIRLRGDQILTIFDARYPNRILLQAAFSAEGSDQRYDIVPDLPFPRLRLLRQPSPLP